MGGLDKLHGDQTLAWRCSRKLLGAAVLKSGCALNDRRRTICGNRSSRVYETCWAKRGALANMRVGE